MRFESSGLDKQLKSGYFHLAKCIARGFESSSDACKVKDYTHVNARGSFLLIMRRQAIHKNVVKEESISLSNIAVLSKTGTPASLSIFLLSP